MSAAHPTRSLPLCKYCKHVYRIEEQPLRCNHPLMPVSGVTGLPMRECWQERNKPEDDRYTLYLGGRPCSVKGLLFERAVVAAQIADEGKDLSVERADALPVHVQGQAEQDGGHERIVTPGQMPGLAQKIVGGSDGQL